MSANDDKESVSPMRDFFTPTHVVCASYTVASCAAEAIEDVDEETSKKTMHATFAEAKDDFNERMRQRDVKSASLIMTMQHTEHRSFAHPSTGFAEVCNTAYDVHHVLASYERTAGETDAQRAYSRRARAGYGNKTDAPRLAEHYTVNGWRHATLEDKKSNKRSRNG